MHLHLIILLSKKANKKPFFYPLIHDPFPSKFKSVYPPSILPVVSLTIVTVFPFLQHLSKIVLLLNEFVASCTDD